MNLVVVSHKECWVTSNSPSGYVTDGGFPFQIQALSELFDRTTLVVPVHKRPVPSGTNPLVGHKLSIVPLDQPVGVHWRRKLFLLAWMPFNLPRVWRAIRRGDAVHALIGGDVGTIGIVMALVLRRPLLVRYCGIWGECHTLAQRFWHWLLIKIAGGRNVVLATGDNDHPPSAQNPAIEWIFSTSMRRTEIESLPRRRPWQPGQPLKLITVGRQESGKNTESIIRALVPLRRRYPNTTLDIVGDGSFLPALRRLTADLSLNNAITFHGRVSHDSVLTALNQADIFCLPTDSEGFPKAVHEAMACGLPAVTTPVSVLSQLVNDRNGILIHNIQPDTIAEAILRLIANERRFAEMSKNVRQISAEYTLERWRDRIGEKLRASWGSLQSDADSR